jgi:hypothetical protein
VFILPDYEILEYIVIYYTYHLFVAWALRLKLGSSREARWRSGSKWKIPGDAARRQRAVVSIPGFLRGKSIENGVPMSQSYGLFTINIV